MLHFFPDVVLPLSKEVTNQLTFLVIWWSFTQDFSSFSFELPFRMRCGEAWGTVLAHTVHVINGLAWLQWESVSPVSMELIPTLSFSISPQVILFLVCRAASYMSPLYRESGWHSSWPQEEGILSWALLPEAVTNSSPSNLLWGKKGNYIIWKPLGRSKHFPMVFLLLIW